MIPVDFKENLLNILSSTTNTEEWAFIWSDYRLDSRLVFGVKCLTDESLLRVRDYFENLGESKEIIFKIKFHKKFIFVENAKLVDPQNEIISRGNLNFQNLMLSFVSSWGEKTRRQISLKFFQLDQIEVPQVKILFQPCPVSINHVSNDVFPQIKPFYEIYKEGVDADISYGCILIREYDPHVRAFGRTE